jgi:predicted transcriptional regulator
MISRDQVRGGRGLLKWSRSVLAQAAGISAVAVKEFENGSTDPRQSTVDKIERAFNQSGVVFLDRDDTGGPGVRLRR